MRYKEGRTVHGQAIDLLLPPDGIQLRDTYLRLIGSSCERYELRRKLVESGLCDEDQCAPLQRTLFAMCFHAEPRLADDNFFERGRVQTMIYVTQAGNDYLEASELRARLK